jgi:hypothetical protein
MSNEGDSGQSVTMPAERAAHPKHSPAGVTMNQQALGEPQRIQKGPRRQSSVVVIVAVATWSTAIQQLRPSATVSALAA